MSSTKLNKLIKIWYYITLFFLAFLGLKFAFPVVLPFALAAVVATFLKKPIEYLCTKTKMKREFVSFLIVSIVLLSIISIISLIFYSIYDWLSDALISLPKLLPTLNKLTDKISNSFSLLGDALPNSIQNSIKEMPGQIIEGITSWITKTLSGLAKGLPDKFVTVFITVVASYLITRDYNKLTVFIKDNCSCSVYDYLLKLKSTISTKAVGIIKSYTIISVITFVQLYLAFMLLKIEHAAAIAFILALLDLLPILGVGIVLVPWAIIMIITKNIPIAVGLLILYAIVTIIRNILTPKIVANQIKLDPLTVLFSMYVGYCFAGFWGLIFAPFVAAIARDLIMYEKTEPKKAQL